MSLLGVGACEGDTPVAEEPSGRHSGASENSADTDSQPVARHAAPVPQAAERDEGNDFFHGGLSGWMAPEAALASGSYDATFSGISSMGGDSGSSGGGALDHSEDSNAKAKSSWKAWAGRRDGQQQYRFGDLTRGVVSQVQAGVREVKHSLANTTLSIKEEASQSVTGLVQRLAEDERPAADAAGPSQASLTAEAGEETSLERWWYDSCMAAHKEHNPKDDAMPGRTVSGQVQQARGSLEVRVLSAGSENSPVYRIDGKRALEKAVEPVCQLTLEGVMTGALHPENWEYAQEQGAVSTARFNFQEIIGTDLRLNVFDQAHGQFKMGFEEKGFCGGAFVPMAAIMEQGFAKQGGIGTNIMKPMTFEMEITVRLLPLSLLRRKRKLEPGESSGVLRPEVDFGHVLLHLKMELLMSPFQLAFAEPVMLPLRHEAAAPASLSDPVRVLQSAAAAVARAGRVLNADPWLTAMDELREDLLSKGTLFVWWYFAALRAPFWAWPIMLALVLPLLSFRMRKVMRSSLNVEPPHLYIDEVPTDSSKDLREQATAAVKGIAKVQVTISNLATDVSILSSKVERVLYALVIGDPFTSSICAVLMLVVAILLSVLLRVVLLLSELGCLHYLVWLAGCTLLLPKAWRQAMADKWPEVQAIIDKYKPDDMLERCLLCFWRRIPDAIEACHTDLCERYVLPGSFQKQ